MNLIYEDQNVQAFDNMAAAILNGNANRLPLKQYKENLEAYMMLEGEGIEEKEDEIRQAFRNYAAKYRKDHEKEYSEKRKFFDLKDEIQRDEVFPVLQKMPKGGLLHVHSAAGLSYERLLLLCTDWNREHKDEDYEIVVNIRSHIPRLAQYTLMYKYQEQDLRNSNIQPVSMELSEFLKIGENADRLKEALCIVNEIEDTARVWKEFNIKYSRFNMLLENKDFFEEYHKRFFEECLEDSIDYVEIRTGFVKFVKKDIRDKGQSNYLGEHVLRATPNFNVEEYLQHIENVVIASNGELAIEDVEFLLSIYNAADKTGVAVKVILTANRGTDPITEADKLRNKIDIAINIKNKTNISTSISPNDIGNISDMVIGFDFVNQEDTQFATCAYKQIMYEESSASGTRQSRMKSIRFFLHDGESNWKQAPSVKYDGIENKNKQIPNIIAGCICSAYRIGHGLTMVQYPELTDAICCGVDKEPAKENLILPAVEINPISNQLLKYQEDLRLHPVFQLLKLGINCVMGNDDPLIFDNPGLSYDFWMLIMDSEVTYDMIKQIVFMGYVFRVLNRTNVLLTPDLEKDILHMAHIMFHGEWEQFILNGDVRAFVNKHKD